MGWYALYLVRQLRVARPRARSSSGGARSVVRFLAAGGHLCVLTPFRISFVIITLTILFSWASGDEISLEGERLGG